VLIDKPALLLRQLLTVLIRFQFISVSWSPEVKVIINTSLKLNYCYCTEPNPNRASCYQKQTILHIHIRYQVRKKYWCICRLYQNASVCMNITAARKSNKGQSAWVTVLPALLYSNLFHAILLYKNAASMYDYTVPNSRTAAKKHSK